MVGYAYPDVLVETQWVADRLDDSNVRLIEVAFDRTDYGQGHIPGAQAWAWSEDFQHPVCKDIPDKAGWQTLLARSGIANETTVVLYGASDNWYATFAFWLLTIYGHRDARVMNGGRAKWTAEGRPLTTDAPVVKPAPYEASEPEWSHRALYDRVRAAIDDPDRVLVDVRDPDEYAGALRPSWTLPEASGQRGGHIPGAVSIPWSLALRDDRTFKPAAELQALFTGHGVTADREAITYCVIGGRSNQTWFVLKYLLGYPRVRLYDGSWLEWGGLIGAPVAK